MLKKAKGERIKMDLRSTIKYYKATKAFVHSLAKTEKKGE